MTKFIYKALILSFVFCLFGLTLPVNGQEVGIKISPIKIDELVKPGDVLKRTLKVTNTSSDPKTFYLFLSDFVADGESGKALLVTAGSSEIGMSGWVDISPQGYDFAAGQEIEIPFTIKVPENVAPGGYYGALEVGTQPPKINIEGEDKGAAMSMAQRAACLLILQVAGEVNEDADIREFISDKTFYGTPFDVKFIERIENKGNTHIKPQGAINIKNMFGKNVSIIRVNENGSNVLRKSVRKFEQEWTDKMAFGRYKAILGLTYGTESSLGGQGKKTLYAERVFWIFPWKIIIPVMLALLLIGAFMAFLLNLYKNKAIKRAMEQLGARQRPYSKNFARRSTNDNNLILKLSIIAVLVTIIILVIYFVFFA